MSKPKKPEKFGSAETRIIVLVTEIGKDRIPAGDGTLYAILRSDFPAPPLGVPMNKEFLGHLAMMTVRKIGDELVWVPCIPTPMFARLVATALADRRDKWHIVVQTEEFR